ncbi:hypothetical protein EDB85DRAFT_1252081 [Lactarius pseudohatsudake]|nr:hypothetical protein EDB85DRAFT_1252081 [Lactarius pseudohatsudake]
MTPVRSSKKVHKKLEISLTFDDEPDPIVTTLASPSSSATARSPPSPRDVAWLALLSLPTTLRPYCRCPLARPLPSPRSSPSRLPLASLHLPCLHVLGVVLPILLSSSSYDRSPCHISTLPDFPLPSPRRPATALTAFTTPLPLAAALGLLLAFLPLFASRMWRHHLPSPLPPASAHSPLLAAVLVALSSLTLALTTVSLVSSLLFAAATTPTLP